MQYSDLDNGFTFGLGAKSNYWFNPYLGVSMGAVLNSSKIDLRFRSPTEQHVSYNLDAPILHLNGILGIKLASPVYKKFGLAADANFMFAPIPFDVVGIDKEIYDPQTLSADEKNRSRVVYTHFNPSYSVLFSVFYRHKASSGKGRMSLGAGFSNYNPYNSYYRAKVDGLRLKEYAVLRPDWLNFVLALRLAID